MLFGEKKVFGKNNDDKRLSARNKWWVNSNKFLINAEVLSKGSLRLLKMHNNKVVASTFFFEKKNAHVSICTNSKKKFIYFAYIFGFQLSLIGRKWCKATNQKRFFFQIFRCQFNLCPIIINRFFSFAFYSFFKTFFLLLYIHINMTSAVQLLRDEVAKELQGSVTIIGKVITAWNSFSRTSSAVVIIDFSIISTWWLRCTSASAEGRRTLRILSYHSKWSKWKIRYRLFLCVRWGWKI